MSKITVRVELNKKIIAQKKLDPTIKLESIRQLIKDKIGDASFIDKDGNQLDTNDEKEFTLTEILYDDNILKVKGKSDNNSGIIIYLNGSNFCSIKIGEEECLSKLRDLLSEKDQTNFDFLDTDGNNIDKGDEGDWSIKEILKDNIVNIKSLEKAKNKNKPENTNTTTTSSPPLENKTEALLPKMKYNLSQYKKIKEEDGMSFYLYSDKKPQSNHKLVQKYYFDNYDDPNSEKEAKIILFVGKTGDGKTTAINAFFNVMKGVRLEDSFRFILIQEPKKEKGQAESQTDGVHIYYLKDLNNKPIIILDSQGFGDTRGKAFDDMVIEAFSFIFTQVIDHINAVSFIVKSTDARLDINIQYIFNQVTGLFSEDISINFFALATHATNKDMKSEPAMIKTLESNDKFKPIKEKMQKKWYYSLDSLSIMEKEITKMSNFSYNNLVELYNEKVINSSPISVKKCSEVLTIRNDLIKQINNLHTTFKDLLLEQGNLKEKEKQLQKVNNQINECEQKIKEEREKFKSLKGNELEKAMNDLNEEISRRMYKIGNREQKQQVKTLGEGSSGFIYTHCEECKENCHDPCDCFHLWTTRCTVYPVFGSECEKCGHEKSRHTRDKFRYKYEYINVKVIDSDEIKRAKEEKERRQQEISQNLNNERMKKNSIERSLENLEKTIEELKVTKEVNTKEKETIEKKIKDSNNEILIIIVRLQSASQRLNDISMRPDYHKTDNEYIDSLIDKYKEVYGENSEKIKELEEMKKYNERFLNASKLKKEEIFKLDHSQLTDLLKGLDMV